MTVVTGAAGYLGNTLIRMLNQQGTKPKAFLYPETDRRGLKGSHIVPVEGDLLDLSSLKQAFEGADTVYHCAAHISIVPGEEKQLYNINVKGTENVLTACSSTGVGRLVFVSTLEAMDWTQGKAIINETAGFHPENACIEYGKTKAEASLLVLSAVEQGLDAVIAVPTGFIGPGDYQISSMTSMILDFTAGKLPAYVGGGFNFIDVRDAAAGVIAAAEKGRTGEAYILGGTYITIADLMENLEELTGKKKPSLKVPFVLANLAARFGEKRGKGGTEENFKPKFTRDSLKVLKDGPRVDCEKAKKELNWAPRPIKETLKDTLEWLKAEGFLS
jgi:dihydroflavonol-4-reductase